MELDAELDDTCIRDATGEAGERQVNTALVATAEGHAKTLQFVLEGFSPDVNHVFEDGTRLLHWAAGMRELGVVQSLLKAGADISALDGDGRTALHIARDEAILSILVRNHGAAAGLLDLAAHNGRTALMDAVRAGRKACAHVLLAAGAQAQARDADGESVLEAAREQWGPQDELVLDMLQQTPADTPERRPSSLMLPDGSSDKASWSSAEFSTPHSPAAALDAKYGGSVNKIHGSSNIIHV